MEERREERKRRRGERRGGGGERGDNRRTRRGGVEEKRLGAEEESRGGVSSPLLHAFLQGRQEELLVETVDGADVGEDSLNDVAGEGGARPSLLQESGTEDLQEEK